jgi:GNAT superfamily N-acetyltransferase
MTRKLEAHRLPSDGYVNLFFVGTSMRGLGWGKRLMSRVEAECRQHGVKRLYLWTDKGCNFGFYDHTGFKRTLEVSSPFLADPGPEANGFAYTKDLTYVPSAGP